MKPNRYLALPVSRRRGREPLAIIDSNGRWQVLRVRVTPQDIKEGVQGNSFHCPAFVSKLLKQSNTNTFGRGTPSSCYFRVLR